MSGAAPGQRLSQLLSPIRRLNAFAFLLAISIAVVATMDDLTVPRVTAPRAEPAARGNAGSSDRIFALVIDSLRYETAIDPRLMPALAELRRHGASARIITTRDAVTVPALRAAFTGTDRTVVLGFLRNFLHGEAGIESLFSDGRAAGVRAAAYSDGSFLQFGASNVDLYSNELGGGDETERQQAAFQAALADFRSGRHAVVVAHVTIGDHRAHEVGVRDPLYAETFCRLDAMVREAAEQIPAGAALVVMGDHGHDLDGRHTPGLDVPTFALYRGSRYRAGADLGTLPIIAHRYLAGNGLGLPLPAGYVGPRPSRALASPLPADERTAIVPALLEPGIPAARRGQVVALAAYFGVLGLLGISLFLDASFARRGLAAWAALAPLLLPIPIAWKAASGSIIAVACLALFGSRAIRRTVWLAGLAGVVGSGFVGWGRLLMAARPVIHHPRGRWLAVMWVALFALAWLLARKWGPGRVMFTILIGALFLFFPTVYSYGAPSLMAPLWLVWLLLHLTSRPRPGSAPPRRAVLLGVATAGILAQFLSTRSHNFQFEAWRWSAVGAVRHGWEALALGSVAMLLLGAAGSRDRPREPSDIIAAIGAAALVTALQAGWIVVGRAELALAVGAIAAAWLLHRRDPPSSRAAWVMAALIALHALIRTPAEQYLWADTLFLALALSIDLTENAQPDESVFRHTFLLVMGVLAIGWTVVAWSMSRLEWGFLYDWIGGATVERHVGPLLPLILLRFAIPVCLVRFLVARFHGEDLRAIRLTTAIVGAKAVSVLLVACGMGWVSVTSDIYLEAVQQAGVWLLVLFGLTWTIGAP